MWVGILDLPVSSWVTSGKLLYFSEPLSPQGSNRLKELLYITGQDTYHISA